jgi:16S rRNA (guanine527-N7)-methyltransferase
MPVEFQFAEALTAGLSNVFQLSQLQLDQMQAHYELMLRWNRHLNLTSIKKPAEIVERHYCESVFLAANLPATAFRVADIGSGPGFPGIPVAIARSEAAVTLVESHQRKAVFLREAGRGLGNVRVLSKRAEEVLESFDWLVSRAVDPADVVRLMPRLSGRVALLIGSEDAIRLSGLAVISWRNPIPLPWGERRVLLIGEYVPRGT